MGIEELYGIDYKALSRVSRKLNDIPDGVDSLKVLNAIAVELNNWIPRHNTPETMEVLSVITARLSPEGKPLPELVNDFRLILTQKDLAAADDAVGGIVIAFRDALEGLRDFIASKGIDPNYYEDAPEPKPPVEVIAREEMLEPTTVEGAEIQVETPTDPNLEPSLAAQEPPPPETAAPAGYKCEFCGYQYQAPPGKFCDNCGRVLSRINIEKEDDAPEFKKCLKCGHRNGLDARICTNCGELLRDSL